ncbi:RING-H2 finger protein ATL2 [Rosa sericea]
MSMSLLFSGIMILGMILICFVIYIVFTVAWYLYGRQIISAPTLSQQEDPAKEKCFSYQKLKPDVITFNYKKELSDDPNHEEENSDQNECVVCLRGLQNEEFVRQLPKCKHTFHAPCIDMWLYSHSDCPICRTVIDQLPDEGAFTPGRKSEVSVDISPSLTLTTISII